MSVFCDWLTVTTPSDGVEFGEISHFLDSVPGTRGDALGEGVREFLFRSEKGALKVTRGHGYDSVSASGGFLLSIRALGLFQDYLSMLSSFGPHTVTRLDASLDVLKDAAPVVRRLSRTYRDGYALGRKGQRVTTLLQTRSHDGALTGSFMVGKRNDALSLLIYDKQHEAAEKRREVLPPTVRYELRGGRDMGLTLRDADAPAPFFYKFMAPDFVRRPADVPEWSPYGEPWIGTVVRSLPAERLRRLVENSPDLRRMVALADEIGDEGIPWLQSLLRKRLEREDAARTASAHASPARTVSSGS